MSSLYSGCRDRETVSYIRDEYDFDDDNDDLDDDRDNEDQDESDEGEPRSSYTYLLSRCNFEDFLIIALLFGFSDTEEASESEIGKTEYTEMKEQ